MTSEVGWDPKEARRHHNHSEAAAVLVQHALEAGGRDNATAVVLDVEDGARVVGTGEALGSLRDLANVVDPASVRLEA